MHVLVSGANGFVGRVLCRTLTERGHRVTGLVRRPGTAPVAVAEWVHPVPEFADVGTHWPASLDGVDCVVHLAARVHVMHDNALDPAAAFNATNVEGTLRVARAAHAHGVRRFVYVSSIKAVAEYDEGLPLAESTSPAPQDPYGRSKLAAEEALWRLRDELGMEIVIVRPPLVYGPGVGANFLQMMQVLSRGIPLPLGAIRAQRSMVYVENLADALVHCATDPRAANACFHVCDSEALTVAGLLRALAAALSKPSRLIPVPVTLIRWAGRVAGRTAQVDRLTGSLRVDASHIANVLDWHPPWSVEQGLEITARWYRESKAYPGERSR